MLAITEAANAQSDRPNSEVEFRATFSIPSGDANFSGTTDAGSTLDFSRDFDFKNEWGYQLRYTYRTSSGKHKFLVDYDDTSWDRSNTLSRSFTFRGETYVANASLEGNLKLRTIRGMYAYRWGNEKFRFGPMVDMAIITTRLDITGTTNNGTRTAEGSITKLGATIGYDLDYDPNPQFSIFHNLGAIAFKGEHLFHTEGGVKFFPTPHIGATGGYKYGRYKVVDDDNFIKIREHGPFVGGVVRF
jgi:hypothetical protein